MTTFSDLLKGRILAIGDGYRAKNEELGDLGPIFLRSGYLQDNGWVLSEPDRISRQPTNGFGSKVAQLDDTVLTTKGNSLGRLGLVDQAVAGSIYSPHLSFWRSLDKEKLHSKYLFYWAHSAAAQHQIKARSHSTDMAPYLSLMDQLALKIELPEIKTQRAVADCLGAIDDKIALNRRIAATLEAMARALFQSWFVDFDPIYARVEGNPTGLPDDLATLFPDSFAKDGLPDDWSLTTVGDLYEVTGGNTPSTEQEEYWGGCHPWVTPKDLSSLTSPVLIKTGRQLTDSGLSQTSSRLLPAGSLILSSRAPIGYMAFITVPTAINQGFAGILRKQTSTTYAWAWCHAHMDSIKAVAGGSTFPEISKSVFRRMPMLLPSRPVLDAFSLVADDLIARIVAAVQQQHTLANIRDTLLPKLISGELDIDSAEQRIAAA